MRWETIGRPGQTGDRKEQLIAEWDPKYGVSNWRKIHLFQWSSLSKLEMFALCEDAYLDHSKTNFEKWERLARDARDVYDKTPDEVNSGTDYTKQLSYTRFHDICIRNVLQKVGLEFTGTDLIQIRWDDKNPDWYSENFDPGKVPFHLPGSIPLPLLKGWWDLNSIECAYQSTKYLQVLK